MQSALAIIPLRAVLPPRADAPWLRPSADCGYRAFLVGNPLGLTGVSRLHVHTNQFRLQGGDRDRSHSDHARTEAKSARIRAGRLKLLPAVCTLSRRDRLPRADALAVGAGWRHWYHG